MSESRIANRESRAEGIPPASPRGGTRGDVSAAIRDARFAILLLLLAGCRETPAPEVADRVVARMGRMDLHLLEVQRAAADPMQPEAIRSHLTALRRELEAAGLLGVDHEDFAPRARRAVKTVRALEEHPWTPDDREDKYATLKSICTGCHSVCGPVVPEPAVPRADSWQACGRCHEKVYREWKGTLHAEAWNDPVFRMAAGNPPKLECRGCHSMEPILERDISTDVSYRPLFRPDRKEEGVNCLSCHGLRGGAVAATRDIPGAPCNPRRDERLSSPVFCGACHNPSHFAYDEWKAGGDSKSCSDCHARKEGKFTHRMRGVHEPDFLKTAVSLACSVADDRLTVALTNRSGHKLPAEVPSRILRVLIRIDDATEELIFRRPSKSTVGLKDNRLLPGEMRRFVRDLKGARSASVEVYYQQSPLVPQEGWAKLAEWSR